MKKVLLCMVIILLYVCFSPTYTPQLSSTQKPLHLKKTSELDHQPIANNPFPTTRDNNLIKKINVQQVFEAGPINLTIHTIQINHITSIDPYKSSYYSITIDYEMLNSAEEDFIFTPIESIEMKNGNNLKITHQTTPSEIMGWETKSGRVQFISKAEKKMNLQDMTLYTSDIRNVNNRTLVTGIKINIK